MNEQQMTALVERVGDSLEPDVARLVAGAAARGRVHRRRRTAGGVLTAMTATAAVVFAATLPPRGGTEAAPDVGAPTSQTRVVAVAPDDMDDALAALLPGARPVVRDDLPYQYQIEHGVVRWRGATVTLAIDSRAVGTAKPAEQRCRAVYELPCDPAPGGAWVVEGGWGLADPGSLQDSATAYFPDGYVIQAMADTGEVDQAVLRDLVLDGSWLR